MNDNGENDERATRNGVDGPSFGLLEGGVGEGKNKVRTIDLW